MGWKEIQRHLTPEEREGARQDIMERMVDIFHKLPSDKEFEAAARAGEAKKGWYASSARAIMDVFGPDSPRFAALLASLSPQVSVKENLRNALRFWGHWIAAGRPDAEKGLDDVGVRAVGKERWFKMNWRPNVVRAMQHASPEKMVLSSGGTETNPKAGKVDSFRANLLGDLSRVTNDAWMAHFADIDQALFSSKAGYLAMTARVRRVAKKMGWAPAEIQETVWSFFKSLHESQTPAQMGRQALGALTHQDIDSTPDFAEMLTNDPEIKHALGQLRDKGLAGEPSQGLRDRSASAGPSPHERAAQAGLAGSLARVADRSEALKRKQDLQKYATRGWSFPNASARIRGNIADITITNARELAELKEKTPVDKQMIVGRNDGKWDLLGGVEIVLRDEQPGRAEIKVKFTNRTTTKPAEVDLDQWRGVERKKLERFKAGLPKDGSISPDSGQVAVGESWLTAT
jgi:hypothetical protein